MGRISSGIFFLVVLRDHPQGKANYRDQRIICSSPVFYRFRITPPARSLEAGYHHSRQNAAEKNAQFVVDIPLVK